jgi:hypothetical protein
MEIPVPTHMIIYVSIPTLLLKEPTGTALDRCKVESRYLGVKFPEGEAAEEVIDEQDRSLEDPSGALYRGLKEDRNVCMSGDEVRSVRRQESNGRAGRLLATGNELRQSALPYLPRELLESDRPRTISPSVAKVRSRGKLMQVRIVTGHNAPKNRSSSRRHRIEHAGSRLFHPIFSCAGHAFTCS